MCLILKEISLFLKIILSICNQRISLSKYQLSLELILTISGSGLTKLTLKRKMISIFLFSFFILPLRDTIQKLS